MNATSSTLELTPAQPPVPPAGSGKGTLTLVLLSAAIMLAACLMFFANLGADPLFNPDESLYAEPAREMLESGEYITTYLNYVVRFTKPPLVIWIMAGCYQIFGVTEFAARYFGAACGAVLATITFLFACRYASLRAGLIAAAVLITAPLYIGTAREAITDMPLSLFIAGALMALFHGYQQQLPKYRWLAYALIGLAVMTKGPVGLIIPGVIVGAYHLLRMDLLAAWRYYRPIAGLAIVAAIAVPWFAVEIYVTKGAYYQEFLVRENFQRFTSVVDHKGAWWYHIVAVLGGFFPWSIFAPQALLQVRQTGLRSPSAALPLFCIIWLLLTVGFFSASVSKLLPYTLPAFPALAVLIGLYIDRTINRGGRFALACPLGLVGIAAGVALYVVPTAITRLHEMPPALPGVINQTLIAIALGALSGCVLAALKRPQAALIVFSSCLFAALIVFGSRALDILSNEWEGPIPAFAQYCSLSNEPIIVHHMRKPSIPFYAHRKVIVPSDIEGLQAAVTRVDRAYIIAKTKDLDDVLSLPGCRLQVKQGRFALIRKDLRSH